MWFGQISDVTASSVSNQSFILYQNIEDAVVLLHHWNITRSQSMNVQFNNGVVHVAVDHTIKHVL